MLLKDYIKGIRKPIATLTLNNGNVQSNIYTKKDFKNIPKDILKMNVMEEVIEDDCIELWLM